MSTKIGSKILMNHDRHTNANKINLYFSIIERTQTGEKYIIHINEYPLNG